MTDRDYMSRAIELAKKGIGRTNPNPMVGAVIVKDGRIIGAGYHEKCGELHAERNAFAALTEPAATLYVTLEPCCHQGRTPPCTEAIWEHGIARVVIGSRDPNPLVSGKGAAVLRKAGVQVEEDFMKEECDRLNPVFFHYITAGLPYVAMKYAMTADGHPEKEQAFADMGVQAGLRWQEAVRLSLQNIRKIGEDLLLEYEVAGRKETDNCRDSEER